MFKEKKKEEERKERKEIKRDSKNCLFVFSCSLESKSKGLEII